MSIRDETTYEELLALLNEPAKDVNKTPTVRIYVGEDTLPILNFIQETIYHDFESMFSGDHHITVQVSPSVHKHLVTNQNNIRVELIKTQSTIQGTPAEAGMSVGRYHNAVMLNAVNPALMAQANTVADANAQEIGAMVDVTFQLMDEYVSDYRLTEVGGILHSATVSDALRYYLGDHPSILGVDVVQPNNDRVYDHIVIPVGTRLTKLPRYLQNNYGIYSSGLGWHLRNERCYTYPLLNHTDFDKKKNTLTILTIPESEIPSMDRTYLVRAGQLFVFSTGEVKHVDAAETVGHNIGTGIRFSRASDLMDRMVNTTSNVSTMSVEENTHVFSFNERPDGKKNIRFTDGRFTDNPWKDMSAIAKGLITGMVLNWDNADPDLLYPGMQVKVMYKDKGTIESVQGVLTSLKVVTRPRTRAITDNNYTTTCVLGVNVKRLY